MSDHSSDIIDIVGYSLNRLKNFLASPRLMTYQALDNIATEVALLKQGSRLLTWPVIDKNPEPPERKIHLELFVYLPNGRLQLPKLDVKLHTNNRIGTLRKQVHEFLKSEAPINNFSLVFQGRLLTRVFHDQIFLGNLGLDGGAGAGETARMDVFRNPPGTPANEERVLLSLLAREHEDVYVDVLVRLQRLSAVRGPGFGGIANDPVLKELRQVLGGLPSVEALTTTIQRRIAALTRPKPPPAPRTRKDRVTTLDGNMLAVVCTFLDAVSLAALHCCARLLVCEEALGCPWVRVFARDFPSEFRALTFDKRSLGDRMFKVWVLELADKRRQTKSAAVLSVRPSPSASHGH